MRSRWTPIEGRLHYVSLRRPRRRSRGPRCARLRSAALASPKPKFVGRAAWGANSEVGGCSPRDRPTRGRVKAAVVHHTVTANDYTEAEAPGIVLGICRYHRNANGWDDIGYNALVDRFGNLYQGRAGGMNRSIVGAQAEGHNLADDRRRLDRRPPDRGADRPRQARDRPLPGLEARPGRASTRRGGRGSPRAGAERPARPKGERIRVNRVLSHSDVNFTECAGTQLRAKIPAIRRAVQARIDEYGGGAPAEPEDPGDPGGGGASP